MCYERSKLTDKERMAGFTLLELIIVIIIVGVLAAVALPRFFRVIETSRVTEARVSIGAIRQGLERCYLMNNGSYSACNSFPKLALEDPGNSPNAHFTYWFPAVGAGNYTVMATRNTREGGSTTTGIQLVCDNATNQCAWTGFGVYQGIQ